MKVGDKLIYRHKVTDLIYEDLDGDFWFEDPSPFKDGSEGTYIRQVINDRDEGYLPTLGLHDFEYFNEEVLEVIEHGKYYNFIDDYQQENCTEVRLTKLAKKVYNIPDGFKGKLYKLEEKE
jgi:hypothetical protein